MQTFFRPMGHRFPEQTYRLRRAGGLLCAVLLLAAITSATSAAQTLAHPGWAGSGLTSEPWWKNALIYRVEPQSFQDSNGDGVGDLRGLAERLDYLQSIGVDAVLLESHATDAGFDDLLSEASRHHIRLVVQLGEGDSARPPTAQEEINEARMWLRRGVAGVSVPGSMLESITARASFNDAIFLMQQLHALAASFPGERIVVAGDTPTVEAAAAQGAGHDGDRNGGGDGPQLIDGLVNTSSWNAASLRLKLAEADDPAAGEPLLRIAREGAAEAAHNRDEQIGREKILAAMLLSSRGALALSYGQEIGLPAGATTVMQWTPTNLTRPEVAAAKAPPQVIYGAYHPYVRPAPEVGRRPGLPKATINTALAPPPVDPDTLPGFSTHPPAATGSFNAALNNVAVEDNDPDSLLNFYRRVLELHSGNATLRTGSVSFLNHDGEDAVVWLRRAPAGARTVASVIVVCNLSERPAVLSLDEDLARLHIRSGFLRPLLTSTHIDHVAQPTSRITLSPHSVFVGELYHYGAYR
jgi:alpha-glucosidase